MPPQKNLLRILLVVLIILLIPFFGNIFVDGWNWSFGDFIVAGCILYIFGLAIDLAARKITRSLPRFAVIAIIITVFFVFWIELATDGISRMVGAWLG